MKHYTEIIKERQIEAMQLRKSNIERKITDEVRKTDLINETDTEIAKLQGELETLRMQRSIVS